LYSKLDLQEIYHEIFEVGIKLNSWRAKLFTGTVCFSLKPMKMHRLCIHLNAQNFLFQAP